MPLLFYSDNNHNSYHDPKLNRNGSAKSENKMNTTENIAIINYIIIIVIHCFLRLGTLPA